MSLVYRSNVDIVILREMLLTVSTHWHSGKVDTQMKLNYPSDKYYAYLATLIFIQPGLQEISTIINTCKVSVTWYWPWPRQSSL